MNKQLSGKTALVTGGSRGIGAAIAAVPAMNGANVPAAREADAARPPPWSTRRKPRW